jgi:hypothetical protein
LRLIEELGDKATPSQLFFVVAGVCPRDVTFDPLVPGEKMMLEEWRTVNMEGGAI